MQGSGGERTYVSRGGLKLRHALDRFGLDPAGSVCADLGCSTGGFTDCLLQADAARVFAVDTAYGQLAWKLRSDERVVVLERCNALHTTPPPQAATGVDLVVVDLGWTRQELAVPAALSWLGPRGRIITLIKPHYEIPREDLRRMGEHGVLPDDEAERVARRVLGELPTLGVRVAGCAQSPIRGGKRAGRGGDGNLEWLALLERV